MRSPSGATMPQYIKWPSKRQSLLRSNLHAHARSSRAFERAITAQSCNHLREREVEVHRCQDARAVDGVDIKGENAAAVPRAHLGSDTFGSGEKGSEAIGSDRKRSEVLGSNQQQSDSCPVKGGARLSQAVESRGRRWKAVEGHGRRWAAEPRVHLGGLWQRRLVQRLAVKTGVDEAARVAHVAAALARWRRGLLADGDAPVGQPAVVPARAQESMEGGGRRSYLRASLKQWLLRGTPERWEAPRSNQKRSDPLKSTPTHSKALRSNQKRSDPLRSTPTRSKALRSNQKRSEALRSNPSTPKHSEAIRNARP